MTTPTPVAVEPGLMSVTFRALGVDEIVGLAADEGLASVSWSGDVHVPVGDPGAARRARRAGRAAGLRVEGYGSYWRATGEPFDPWLAAAVALGAPRVRVWAGDAASATTTASTRASVAAALARAADLAATEGVELALEFHRNTLTDTAPSTVALLAEVDSRRTGAGPVVRSHWQPRPGVDVVTAVAELRAVAPRLAALHVFSWDAAGARLPLAAREDLWHAVLRELTAGPAAGSRGARPLQLLLEFVRGDSAGQFRADAAAFRSMISRVRD